MATEIQLHRVSIFKFIQSPDYVLCHPDSVRAVEDINRVMVQGFETQKKLREELDKLKKLIRERREIGQEIKALCSEKESEYY